MVVPLSEVADINPPAQKLDPTTPIDFAGMAELSETLAVATPRASAEFRDYAKGYTQFKNGDILVAKITPCWENGKVGQAKLNHQFAMGSTEFHVVRPSDTLNDRYLLHFLRQEHVRLTGTLRMTGSGGQRRVPKKYLTDIKIPLPHLDEQRRIAAILDKADAIRQKRRQIFEHLEGLSQSLFLHFFKDHTKTCTFSSLVDEFRYGTSNRSVDTGYPTLRIPNVVQSRLSLADIKYVPVSDRELEKLKLQNGDLLFVRTNGTLENVGRCSIFSKNKVETSLNIDLPWIYASYLIRARLKDGTSPEFIHGFFTSTKGRASIRKSSRTSAGQYNININGISKVQIPTVPKNKQNEFAAISARIDALSNEATKQISIADEVFAALQSRAFRGEL